MIWVIALLKVGSFTRYHNHNKGDVQIPERKIWGFESFTLCGLLGLAFDDVGMVKIFKRLRERGLLCRT